MRIAIYESTGQDKQKKSNVSKHYSRPKCLLKEYLITKNVIR